MYTLDKASYLRKGVCGVYAIFISSNPSVAYIGSSKDIRKRLMTHHNKLKKGIHENWRLKSMWGFYSSEFRWKIIETHHTEDEAREAEQIMLNFTDDDKLYNVDKRVYRYNTKDK